MASPAEDTRLDADFGPLRHDAPTGESIADLLRRTRESYGQDIEAVASQLRIRKDYLRAIEEGRFRDLPGATYAVGFVRTYAEYLGLDTQEVLRRFREEVAEVSGQTQLIFPAAAAEGKLPGGAILFLSIVLAAVAYGVWYYLSDRKMNLLELVPPVPERLMSLVSGEAVPEGGGTAVPAAEAVPEAGDDGKTAPEKTDTEAAAGEPADQSTVAVETSRADAAEPAAPDDGPAPVVEPVEAPSADEDAAPAAEEVAVAPRPALPPPAPEVAVDDPEVTVAAIPAAPAAPPPDDGGQVFGTAHSDARVVLRARLESWVQVTDADGTILLTRILRAGDRYLVPNEPGVKLTTGNAGGLDILVDGRAMPPLGPVGVVRRDVALDPEQLIAGAAFRD